jgi:hypothetical protein
MIAAIAAWITERKPMETKIDIVYRTSDGEIHDDETVAKLHQTLIDLDVLMKKYFTYGPGENYLDSEKLTSAIVDQTEVWCQVQHLVGKIRGYQSILNQ